jgi:hypothetical protein
VLAALPFWAHKDLMRLYRKRGMQERAVGLLAARRHLGLPVDRFLHNDAIGVAAEQGWVALRHALLSGCMRCKCTCFVIRFLRRY